MNQPHPPLPDYRPERTPEDPAEPRTQSILIPPTAAAETSPETSGATTATPEETTGEATAEEDASQADDGTPAHDATPGADETPLDPAATGATAVSSDDFRPEVGPGPAFSPGAGAPPPLPGPRTGPQPDWSPPGWSASGVVEPATGQHAAAEPAADLPAAEEPAGEDRLPVSTHLTTPVDVVPGFSEPGVPDPGTSAPGTSAPGPSDPGLETGGAAAAAPTPATKPSALPPPRVNAPWPTPGPATRPGPQAAPHPSPTPRTDPRTETTVLPPMARRTRDLGALAALALGVVGLALVELGLLLEFADNRSLWSALPTWSAFATVAALVGLVPALLRVLHRDPLGERTSWRAGAVGAAALVGFWVLIALPLVASDRGFLLTLGTAATAAAVWVTPGRPAPRS